MSGVKQIQHSTVLSMPDRFGAQSMRYALLAVLSFSVNIGLAFGLNYAGLTEQWAFLVALVTVFMMNFCGFRWFVFRTTRSPLGTQFLHYTMTNGAFRLLEYGAFTLLGLARTVSYQWRVLAVLLGSFVIKFFVYRFVVFRAAKSATESLLQDERKQGDTKRPTISSQCENSHQWSNRAVACTMGLLVAELLKITLFVVVIGPQELRKDSLGYWNLGREVAQGDLFFTGSASTFRPPGYPWFLGAIQTISGGESTTLAVSIQGGIIFLTTLLTGYICWLLTKSPWAVVASLLASLLCIDRTWYATAMMSETLFIFLMSVHVALWIRWAISPTWHAALLAAIPLALTVLTKSVAQYYATASVAAMLIHGSSGFSWKNRLAHAVVALGTVILLLTPWYARNYQMIGKPVLATASGRSLWLSAFKENCGNLPLPVNGKTRELKAKLNEKQIDYGDTWAVYGTLRAEGSSEQAADGWMKKTSVEAIRSNPVPFARSVLERLGQFWTVTQIQDRGQLRYKQAPRSIKEHAKVIYRWLSIRVLPIVYAALALLATGGFVLYGWKRSLPIGLFCLGTMFYFALVSSIGAQPSYRYHMILEPLLICGAVVTFHLVCARQIDPACDSSVVSPAHRLACNVASQ